MRVIIHFYMSKLTSSPDSLSKASFSAIITKALREAMVSRVHIGSSASLK